MPVRISISYEASLTLLAILHGAIDDADGDTEELRLLVEIENATREARRIERQASR